MATADPQEQLVLISAATAHRRAAAAARVRALASVVEWASLAELLQARRLLPTLGPRIVELAPEQASDEFKQAVQRSLGTAHRHGSLLKMLAERALRLLTEAGIHATALKGPRLAERLYGDPGRRLTNDIDLLVSAEQLREAVETVRTLGYASPSDHVEGGLPLLHYALTHERGELPPIELHWRVHWYEQDFARERLLPPSGADAWSWRAAPADELAALLLFYAKDGFFDLRHATDVGALWDAERERLPAGALGEVIDAYPALGRALTTAASVAQRTVGLPAKRLMALDRRLGARAQIAARIASPLPRASAPQLYAEMGLVDGLLAPTGGLQAFVRRQILPPRGVLRERAREPGQRAGSPLGHGARVLARYALALARVPMRRPNARVPFRTRRALLTWRK